MDASRINRSRATVRSKGPDGLGFYKGSSRLTRECQGGAALDDGLGFRVLQGSSRLIRECQGGAALDDGLGFRV
jgi:hypothetical protein